MKKLIGFIVCSAFLFSCTDKPAETPEAKTASATEVSKDYEFADMKFVDIGKKHMALLEKGDIDTWMADFADNAIYRWNNLDSLTGKAAITDYWKKRRADVIESMAFSSDVWLPIKVNKAMTDGQLTGNYALCWYMCEAKYKTGKGMKQRIHSIFHFDGNDKIDRVFQYLDRASINAATTK